MVIPEISIVVATHNRSNLLPLTIESLTSQTFSNIEIIIVDDSSTDNTLQVMERIIRTDPRIIGLHSEINVGPGAARNLGINKAQGKYIAIIDDDDIALPNRLEVQKKVLDDYPEVGLVCSIVEFINKDRETIGYSTSTPNNAKFPAEPDDIFVRLYLEGSIIANPTIMARKEVWDKFKYPAQPWDAEDRFLFLQMAASGVRMKLIEQPLVKMLHDPGHKSLTALAYQKRIQAKRQILSMTRKWLGQEGIHQFDKYHKIAVSNQFLRESMHYRRNPRALILIMRAFLSSPKNREVKKRLFSYLKAFSGSPD